MGPIVVYGATGYTGRLVAAELARLGLEAVLSGRDATRLHAVAEQAGLDAPVRAAALDDRDALRHAMADCAAVINCAGPFTRYGEPVVRAAVETGTHYVDTTGEQLFMKRVFDRHDDAAQAAEVAVVPAIGFDYLPGDMICRLTAAGVEPVEELVLAYYVKDFGGSRGTLHSALEALRVGPVQYRDGDWRPAPSAPSRASFTFPEPIGRQPMAPYPCGEVITVPRHTQVRTIRSLISAGELGPHPAVAGAMPFVLPALGLALRTPLKTAIDAAIDRLPDGPPEDARRAARFHVAVTARGADGRTAHGAVSGSDVYGLTAVMAVHSASLLAAGEHTASGVLAPASAFDAAAFLDHLAGHGVTYEVDGVAEAAPV